MHWHLAPLFHQNDARAAYQHVCAAVASGFSRNARSCWSKLRVCCHCDISALGSILYLGIRLEELECKSTVTNDAVTVDFSASNCCPKSASCVPRQVVSEVTLGMVVNRRSSQHCQIIVISGVARECDFSIYTPAYFFFIRDLSHIGVKSMSCAASVETSGRRNFPAVVV